MARRAQAAAGWQAAVEKLVREERVSPRLVGHRGKDEMTGVACMFIRPRWMVLATAVALAVLQS